jgi:catechol 2,3-dioxygenase-like lactoylglutathione lyase family enzyme
MIKISHLCMWVHDQDEALTFYRDKLGFDVRADVTMEDFRWLTVSPPSQPELELSLLDPAPLGPEMRRQALDLLAAGGMGGAILQTDDCRAAFAELSGKGVEFTEEPNERFYGVDAGFRDPSGNGWRLVQPIEQPAAVS